MLKADNIMKSFQSDGSPTLALSGVSLTIEAGQFVSVVGRSGSGKTTFLNILSTLLAPDSGTLTYDSTDLTNLSEREMNDLRHNDFAVIFQFHHLLPYLTALENTLLPFMNTISSVTPAQMEKAHQCLARVGLSGKHDRLPSMLSGGEQQRVAIARALVKDARILFADEPTGSLDKATGEGIMELLQKLNSEGLAVVMVTHNQSYSTYADTVVEMEDGKVKGIQTSRAGA